MARVVRELLEGLGAKPSASAEEGVFTLDARPLGLSSIFGGELAGEAVAKPFSDEAFSFAEPEELAALGVFWVPHLERPSQLRAAVKDAHDRLRRKIDDQLEALERVGFTALLEPPEVRARGKAHVGGHTVEVAVGPNEELLLLAVDGAAVPKERRVLVADLDEVDEEETQQRLGERIEALKEAGVLRQGRGRFDAETVRAPISSAERAKAVRSDDGTDEGEDFDVDLTMDSDEAAAPLPPPNGASLSRDELAAIAAALDDEDDLDELLADSDEGEAILDELSAKGGARPDDDGAEALGGDGGAAPDEEALDAMVEEADGFDEPGETRAAEASDKSTVHASPFAAARAGGTSAGEADPASRPPDPSLAFDLDDEPADEDDEPTALRPPPRVDAASSRSSEEPAEVKSASDEAEISAEGVLSADDLSKEHGPKPTDPELSNAREEGEPAVNTASAPGIKPPPSDDALPLKAPREEALSGLSNLAAVVGEGLSTGKTGAIELDAEAFAYLQRDELAEAEALEQEAALLESRARELRSKAERLRQRHAKSQGGGRRTLAKSLEEQRARSLAVPPSAEAAAFTREGLPVDISVDAFASKETAPKERSTLACATATPSASAGQRTADAFADGVALEEVQALFRDAEPAAAEATQLHEVELPVDELEDAQDDDDVFGSGGEAGRPTPAEPEAATRLQAQPPEASFWSDLPQVASADVQVADEDFDSHENAETRIAPGMAMPDLPSSPQSPRVAAKQAAPEPHGVRVALVVNDPRALARLQKHLSSSVGELLSFPSLLQAAELPDVEELDALVIVRPPLDGDTLHGFEMLEALKRRPPTLVLSSDPGFDAMPGVDLRLALARRAAEVAQQVREGLSQLGVRKDEG